MRNQTILSLVALTVLLAPSTVNGQVADSAAPPVPAATHQVLTILTQPGETRLRLKSNASDVHGLAPLDLPGAFEGHFSVTVEGPAVARTQGSINIPSRGAVTLLSEPRGVSLDLFIRSLNLPGIPDLAAGRVERGILLATSFTGGLVGATRAHLQYRDRLGEFGDYAADRARDERLARNAWARYAAATWAVSAVDYWIRPRIEIEEVANERVVISAPTISRASVVWRSLIVPGAGQEFANHRQRGAFWLGAALAAGAGIVVADGMVERDQTRTDWAKALIDSAGPSEVGLRVRDWERRKRDLQSSEDLRRGFRYALIGTYLVNIVDALVVPTGGPAREGTRRVSTSAIVRPDGPELQATLHF